MQYALIDAFTDKPFAGNPAAVVRLEQPLPDAGLIGLAAEFNCAETSFVRPRADGSWDLRWCTPVKEIALCGHATLAAAHALWQWRAVDPAQPITFQTRWHGQLVCTHEGAAIAMRFPATPAEPSGLPPDAARVLRVLGPVSAIGTGPVCLALALPSADQVRAARPDLAALALWHEQGVCITAPGDQPGIDLVCRYFAPRVGIPEDPVTGSAHCLLAVHWAQLLGKDRLVSRQLSPRGGRIEVLLAGAVVELRGQAVTVAEGHLSAPAVQAALTASSR